MKTLIIFVIALLLITGCSSEKKSEQTSDNAGQSLKANVEGQITNIQKIFIRRISREVRRITKIPLA